MMERIATLEGKGGKSVDVCIRDYGHGYELELNDDTRATFDSVESAVKFAKLAWGHKWDLAWNTDFTVKGEENKMKVKVIKVKNERDLYCHYSGQIYPQSCFIDFDLRSGELSAGYDCEIGNGTWAPAAVWNGSIIRMPISRVKAEAANYLMEALIPLAEAVMANNTVVWDGSNWVGRSTDEGRSVAALNEYVYEYTWDDDAFIDEDEDEE